MRSLDLVAGRSAAGRPAAAANAVALLAALALAGAGCSPARHAEPPLHDGQRQVRIDISGMTDAISVASVSHHLARVAGVRQVEVNLEMGAARVLCESAVPDSELVHAVRRAGEDFTALVVH